LVERLGDRCRVAQILQWLNRMPFDSPASRAHAIRAVIDEAGGKD
jgi:hypothetical protein